VVTLGRGTANDLGHRNEAFGIGPHLIELTRSRGEAMLPYLLQHVEQVWSRQRRGGYDDIVELARSRGWWELWAALIRISASPADYDREVHALLADSALPEADLVQCSRKPERARHLRWTVLRTHLGISVAR